MAGDAGIRWPLRCLPIPTILWFFSSSLLSLLCFPWCSLLTFLSPRWFLSSCLCCSPALQGVSWVSLTLLLKGDSFSLATSDYSCSFKAQPGTYKNPCHEMPWPWNEHFLIISDIASAVILHFSVFSYSHFQQQVPAHSGVSWLLFFPPFSHPGACRHQEQPPPECLPAQDSTCFCVQWLRAGLNLIAPPYVRRVQLLGVERPWQVLELTTVYQIITGHLNWKIWLEACF